MLKKLILDNGIPLYLDPVPEAETVGFLVLVKTGLIHEPNNRREICHLLEHMMFRSNEKYTSKEIAMGIELSGGYLNGYTDTIYTGFVFECIPKSFSKCLDIFWSMFENKKFREDELELEKRIVVTEMERRYNNPDTMLNALIPYSVYGESDYGLIDYGHKREHILEVAPEELAEWKERNYTPDNICLLICGKVKEEFIKEVEDLFSNLEGKCKKKEPEKGKGKDICHEMETRNQIYFALNYTVNLKPFECDAIEFYSSWGMSSPFFQIFREKKGIGYKLFFAPAFYYPDEVIFSLAIFGFEKEKKKFLQEAINEFLSYIRKPEYKDEFRKRKNLIEYWYKKERTKILDRTVFYLENLSLGIELTYDEYYQKILSLDFDKFLALLDNLKEKSKVEIYGE